MKPALFALLATTFFTHQAFAVGAMQWTCKGTDIDSEDPVSFTLVLSEHDGRDFQYKALENYLYDGVSVPDVDLSLPSVECGKDDDGNPRLGRQEWELNVATGFMRFYSGCENEAVNIETICTR